MSDSIHQVPVSVELGRADWEFITERLRRVVGEIPKALAAEIEKQLPPPTPTGFGAVVVADVPGLGRQWLVLSNPHNPYCWRTQDGDSFRPDQFRIYDVLSMGVDLP